MLKTAVDLASLRSSARTIMVSSAVAGEGKSTVSANLAVAAAAAGRRVALVDLDLRRPVLAATFGLTDARPDVAAVLNGEAPVANAFHDVDLGAGTNGGSLRVLASRPSQATPSALLEKPALSKLIETLSRDFDLVILDTPPLLSVSDAGVIARTADAILVVVRAGEVAQAALVDTSRLLFSFDVPKLGFVFTDSAAAGGYGYSYGYGAAYGEPRPVAANGSQRPVTAAVGADD